MSLYAKKFIPTVVLIGKTAAWNNLRMEGGAITNSSAFAVVPVPPLVEVTAVVSFFFRPGVKPVTVRVIVQVSFAAIVAKSKEYTKG